MLLLEDTMINIKAAFCLSSNKLHIPAQFHVALLYERLARKVDCSTDEWGQWSYGSPARFLRRDSVSSIAYSEELMSDTISATLQSTDRYHGIVDQEPDHFQRDS
jgi:hypothetical protein